MKIYLNDLNESWVVDRFRNDWIEFNTKFTTDNLKEADIIWIIAPWVWNKVPKKYLSEKKSFAQFIILTLLNLVKKIKKSS